MTGRTRHDTPIDALSRTEAEVWFLPAPGAARDALRGLTHQSLAQRLGVPSLHSLLLKDTHGQPKLRAPYDALKISFSYTADLVGIALTSGRSIGLDIESVRRVENIAGLAPQVLPADECARLAAMPVQHQSRVFLQHWTRTEAALKAEGAALAKRLDEIRHDGTTRYDCPVFDLSEAEGLPKSTVGAVAGHDLKKVVLRELVLGA